METINNTNKYQNFTFDHMVEFPKDDCTFTAGYDSQSGKSHIFLIFNHNGRIYARNGRENSWAALGLEDAEIVRQKSARARAAGIPRYSCSDSLANNINL